MKQDKKQSSIKKCIVSAIMTTSLCLSTTVASFVVEGGKVQAAATVNSTLVWSDEFNGSSLDGSKWNMEVRDDGCGNHELQYYTDRTENVSVHDGYLELKAMNENYGSKNYTSGRITTQNKFYFTYGHIEARLSMPSFSGIWPAFWMLGQNINQGVGWPACGEIDIMEAINAEDKVYATCHWKNGSQQSASGNLAGINRTDWHIYTCDWDEESIRICIDGREIKTVSINDGTNGKDAFHKDFFLLFNLAVGGDWPGNNIDDSQFPASMKVDYVRVYQDDISYHSASSSPVDPDSASQGTSGLTGKWSDWQSYVDNSAAASISTTADGEARLDITKVGTYGWSVQMFQSGLNLKAGKQYKVSVEMESTTARSVKVSLENFNSATNQATAVYGTETVALQANQPTEISFTTDALSEDTSSGKMYIGLGQISGSDTGSTITIRSVKVEEENPPVQVTGISVTQEAVSLKTGESKQLEVTVLPEDAANKKLRYESNNTSVAMVSSAGNIEAVGEGTAEIMIAATDGSGVQKKVTVTVELDTPSKTPEPSEDIEVELEIPVLTVGQRSKITVMLAPDIASDAEITFESDNPSIAKVWEDGTVEAVGEGQATIRIYVHDGNEVKWTAITVDVGKKDSGSAGNTGNNENNNTNENNNNAGNNNNTDHTGNSSVKVMLGQEFIYNKLVYKVTSVNPGAYTVKLTRPVKKTYRSVMVPATVTCEGMTFKVTSIVKNTFKKNKKLKTVVIDRNVKKIGAKAFYGCKRLKKITVRSSNIRSIGKKAFTSINGSAVIRVPSKKLAAYKKLLKKAKISSKLVIKRNS